MLLGVDTSTAQIGLALYDGAQVIGEFAWRSSQRHTVELAPAISDLLTRCGHTIEDVSALEIGRASCRERVSISVVGGSPNEQQRGTAAQYPHNSVPRRRRC